MIVIPTPAGPGGPTRVQARGGGDFTIPPPQGPGTNPPATAPPQPAPQAPVRVPSQAAPRTETGQAPFGTLERGASPTEIVLGGVTLLVLAVLFLFVRQGVRVHLINRRAALDAANGASWMLFSALMLTAGILVTATVGRLWQAWGLRATGFGLCLVLFGVALFLLLRAPERRR